MSLPLRAGGFILVVAEFFISTKVSTSSVTLNCNVKLRRQNNLNNIIPQNLYLSVHFSVLKYTQLWNVVSIQDLQLI